MDESAEQALWDRFDILYETLTNDVTRILKQIRSDDSHVWRRMLYHSAFVLMEGVNKWMKTYVAETYGLGIVGEDTYRLLRDQRLHVNAEGNQHYLTSFKPFTETFFIAFDTFAWVAGSDFCPDTNCREWTLLKRATNTRNRIVHPKKPEDLEVTIEDLDLLRRLLLWYMNLIEQLFIHTGAAILEEAKGIRDAWCKEHPEDASLFESIPSDIGEMIRSLEEPEF